MKERKTLKRHARSKQPRSERDWIKLSAKADDMWDQGKSDRDDHDGDQQIDQDLRALHTRVEAEPISDDLKRLAKQLEERLKKRDED
jgi:hypothetical protein